MGNSMLKRLIENGPVMRTVSLPRGRHSLHTMPTSTGYEIRTDATYDWDGRKRGQTPFTVLQHTIAGAGNLRYENRTYRVREGRRCWFWCRTITVTGWSRTAGGSFSGFP